MLGREVGVPGDPQEAHAGQSSCHREARGREQETQVRLNLRDQAAKGTLGHCHPRFLSSGIMNNPQELRQAGDMHPKKFPPTRLPSLQRLACPQCSVPGSEDGDTFLLEVTILHAELKKHIAPDSVVNSTPTSLATQNREPQASSHL